MPTINFRASILTLVLLSLFAGPTIGESIPEKQDWRSRLAGRLPAVALPYDSSARLLPARPFVRDLQRTAVGRQWVEQYWQDLREHGSHAAGMFTQRRDLGSLRPSPFREAPDSSVAPSANGRTVTVLSEAR